ncbi:hypothetical protein ACIBG8_24240 [Nonomuraea sp. NPDC050556]|uniref:DUF7158 domain-containing protein n=1 Tax=Nonomuraea sp. NPDC050556 TaxID=3364369 RepID=UPI0037BD98BE
MTGHGHGHVLDVIGYVGGQPVPRAPLDARIRELREGPLNAALPVEGSSEDRQLARWLTQVILTEVLCEDEGRARGLVPLEGPPLDRLAAVELGSINASAYNGSPWVRALFEAVTAAVEIPSAWRPAPEPAPDTLVLVRHGLFENEADVTEDRLDDLGVTSLTSLPSAIAEELARQPYGTLVGPVRDALGWHLAIAQPVTPASQQGEDGRVGAARRRAFARWLDERRAERVELVPGLEHPGDPRQPDNHHKH